MAEPDNKEMNLYQKLAAITGEIGPIAKGGQNQEQHYAFIEYAAVAGALRDLFAKYGVVIVPRMQQALKQSRQQFRTSGGKNGTTVLIDFYFDVVNADKPEDHFVVRWTGEATDYGDKGTNKAATAALKYYLMRQFNISEKGEEEADARTPDPKFDPVVEPEEPEATEAQLGKITSLLTEKGVPTESHQKFLAWKVQVEDVAELTLGGASRVIDFLTKMKPVVKSEAPAADDQLIDTAGGTKLAPKIKVTQIRAGFRALGMDEETSTAHIADNYGITDLTQLADDDADLILSDQEELKKQKAAA